MVKLLWAWLKRLWSRPPPPPGHNRPPPGTRSGMLRKVDRRDVDPLRNETMSHYYLDDLLGDLDMYFTTLRRMRRCDPGGYALYRQIGAQLLPQHALVLHPSDLPATWRDGSDRPASGMCHFECSNRLTEDDVTPTARDMRAVFGSYKKLFQPKDVELCSDDIYECSIYYQHRKINGGNLVVGSFFVGVDAAGKVRQLRQRMLSSIKLPRSKYRRLRQHGRQMVLHRSEWRYPEWLSEPDDKSPWTAVEWFRALASAMTYSAGDGLQVRVRKGGITARFHIGLLRTPYFFKDREKTVTVNGATRRIFHIVRAHKRVLAGGQERFVKTHFRGLRRFIWHDYAVVISMPGYHHIVMDDFSVRAKVSASRSEELIPEAQVGTMLDHLLDDDMHDRDPQAVFQAAQRAAGIKTDQARP